MLPALPFFQILYLHEKGESGFQLDAIKRLVHHCVRQLIEGRDHHMNAASYCFKKDTRVELDEGDVLSLTRVLVLLHQQARLAQWWGSALVVARCLEDNTHTRDRKELAACLLSLIGDPALEENADSPLFVLGELLAVEYSKCV